MISRPAGRIKLNISFLHSEKYALGTPGPERFGNIVKANIKIYSRSLWDRNSCIGQSTILSAGLWRLRRSRDLDGVALVGSRHPRAPCCGRFKQPGVFEHVYAEAYLGNE